MVEENENESDKAKRLKDLELNLAKELDAGAKQVKVPAPDPNSSTITSGGQPNSPMEAAPAQPTPPPKSDGKAAEVSLNEIDEMLRTQDPEFEKQVDGLKGDLGAISPETSLESIGLPDDFITSNPQDEGPEKKEDVKKESAKKEAPAINLGLLNRTGLLPSIFKLIWTVTLFPPRLIGSLFPLIKKIKGTPPKQLLSEIGPLIKPEALKMKESALQLKLALKAISPLAYFKFFAMVGLVVGSTYLFKAAYKSLHTAENLDLEIVSYDKVADRIFDLNREGGAEAEEALNHPEFVVQIARIFANLKPDSTRRLSMISVELYLETSNQEAAVEIKDREQEIIHVISRVLEQWSFDDLDNTTGKNKLKIYIRASLNKVLTKGRIRRVFYKSFNIQK